MKPSLIPKAGKAYDTALLLLCPAIAALTRDEFAELVNVIKSNTYATLDEAYQEVPTCNAVMVASALSTRFSHEPGMSEASEIVMASALYMDTDTVMSPSYAKFETNFLAETFPSLSNAIDSLGDLAQNILVSKDSSLSTETPPSLVIGPDSLAFNPGYTNGMIAVMYNTFTITEGGSGDASNSRSIFPVTPTPSGDSGSGGNLFSSFVDGAATIAEFIPPVV